MKNDPSASGNPFQRHSTLLGAVSAFVVMAALGWLTHWRLELLVIPLLAFPVSFVLFARLFYGFGASRRLDKELISPASGSDWVHAKYDIDEPGYQLTQAYEKAQGGDVTDLKRLAEEEESS